MPGSAVEKIDELCTFLRGNIDEFEKLSVEHILRNFAMVVKSEYRRLTIGTELLKTIERMGKVFEIPSACVTLTGTASQVASAKLDCILLNEVRLIDYVDEDRQNIFPVVDPHLVIQYGYFKFS